MTIDNMDRSVVTPWWRREMTLVIGGLVLFLAIAGAGGAILVSRARSTIQVAASSIVASPVKTGVFRDFTPVRAQVAPLEVITIDAGEGGQAVEVLVRSGDQVAAGQTLARFKNPDLEMQVLERQSSLISAISQLQEAAKRLEDARVQNARETARLDYDIAAATTVYQRQQTLFEKGFVAAAARDKARDELNYLKAQRPLHTETTDRAETLRTRRMPEIDAEIGMLRQTLTALRARLGGLSVNAPVAGRIGDFSLTLGETKTRGAAIAKLTPDRGYKLLATVDPYYLPRVRAGQTAAVTIAGVDGLKEATARVRTIDPTVKDGSFRVELEFEGASPSGITEGQLLEGRLSLGRDAQAVITAAGPWLDTSGGAWAMVINRDGKTADRRTIEVGRRNAEDVEILKGLRPGEQIITSSYAAFEKVQRVKIKKAKG